jgi:hypothetical protein
MNKLKTFLAAASLAFVATTVSALPVITVENAGQMTTTQTGVTTVDFNDGTIGDYTATGFADYTIFGTPSGTTQSASPLGVTDKFLSVPNPISSGTAAFSLNGDFNYFGLFWGSVDTYNTLSFWSNNSVVASFTGAQITPLLANGAQANWTSNRYVNFFFNGTDTFDEVRLRSTSYAFETDNHSFGVVPEPSAIALFGLGLFGLAFAARRKRV